MSQADQLLHLVVHFMGHSTQRDSSDMLCFEKENGEIDRIDAKRFFVRIRGEVFLVTLNSCVSAAPGPTHFSNFARSLVEQKIPRAQGMWMRIDDKEAFAFSQRFYSDLAHEVPIEKALLYVEEHLKQLQRKRILPLEDTKRSIIALS